jgi:hypothetical protein
MKMLTRNFIRIQSCLKLKKLKVRKLKKKTKELNLKKVIFF